MSVLFHRPRNCWRCTWTQNGRQVTKYFKTEDEARAFDRERLSKLCADSSRLTLGELAVLFFRSHQIHHKTKRNVIYFLAGHERNGVHVPGAGEFLRDKYADSLTRLDLETMREILRARGVSNVTMNKYQAYLHSILAWGVDEQLINRNPWRDFRRLKIKKKIINVTLSDVCRVSAAAPDWLSWSILTTYALAMRPGIVELFSLTWDAFHWRLGVVQYRQAKSGSVKRVVPPDWYLIEAQRRYTEDMAAGIPWVCHRAGRRVLTYQDAWLKAVRAAGLSGLRFYDVRHVAASEMLAAGAELPAVSAQLGHASTHTTATTYAHAVPGAQHRAAALVPSLVSSKK